MGWRDWLGVGERRWKKAPDEEVQPAKTLWDWLQLLIVPAILIGVTFVWSATQTRSDNKRAEQVRQDATLNDYIKQMSDLMLHEKLLTAKSAGLEVGQPPPAVTSVARTLTLTTLRRLDEGRRGEVVRFLHEARLLVSGTPASGVNLRGADLEGADLAGANLEGANLAGANLRGADLARAYLVDADLYYTDLTGANLPGANLGEADLPSAILDRANLVGANLEEAEVIHAQLTEANLTRANLRGTNFLDSNLTNANLTGANLTEATFTEAILKGAKGLPKGRP